VTAGLVESDVVVAAIVLVAPVVVLVAATAGVPDAMFATSVVDVDAGTTGLVAEVEEDDAASTWAAARRISKMPERARATRTRRPIPMNVVVFVFISRVLIY
jgi:hypothetical protein